MGNNNTVPMPAHFAASAEGLADEMVSAPHDVLCELGGQRVYLREDATSEAKRKKMLDAEITYQRKRVQLLQKQQQQHCDPTPAGDCESGREDISQPSPAASGASPFVVLPDPGSRQTAYSVVQSSKNYLFVPSKAAPRRASVPGELGLSADEYLEKDLEIKRAAMESDICEIAGIQPLSMRVEAELQPSLGTWDLDTIFDCIPPDATPEEASIISNSLMEDPDAEKPEIILFPKRAPVCHLSAVAAVAALPVAAVILQTERELQQQLEDERQREKLEAANAKQQEEVIAEEAASREVITEEENKEAVDTTSLFQEGLSRLRLLTKLPVANVLPSPSLLSSSPSTLSSKAPSLLTPVLGPSQKLTPRELHDQMLAAERQQADAEKENLLLLLAPLQSDESRSRDELTVDEGEVFTEFIDTFAQQHSVIKTADDIRAKEEVTALMNKVDANLRAASTSPSPSPSPSAPPADIPKEVTAAESPPPSQSPPLSPPTPDVTEVQIVANNNNTNSDTEDHPPPKSKKDSTKAKAARKNALAKELNAWKEDYKTEHGKMPTKKKILADESICDVYQEYLALEKEIGKKSKKGDKEVKESPEVDPPLVVSQVREDEQTNTRYERTEEQDSPTVEEVHEKMITATDSNGAEQLENGRYSDLVQSPTNATTKTPKERKHELAQQLNTWKAAFTEQHGAPPTKGALRSDPSISSVYSEYEQLTKDLKASKPKEANKKKSNPRKAIVVKQLNEWKAAFEQEHGKPPTKKNMTNGDDTIKALYSEYLELNKKHDENEQKESSP